MSELKVLVEFEDFGPYYDTPAELYDKAEADKVIAELKADYKEACDRLQTANIIKDEQLAETSHSKYKRCLAMAELCDADACYQEMYIMDDKKATWFFNWEYKWRKLAEKFKEE